jgi:hypothetical protein
MEVSQILLILVPEVHFDFHASSGEKECSGAIPDFILKKCPQ